MEPQNVQQQPHGQGQGQSRYGPTPTIMAPPPSSPAPSSVPMQHQQLHQPPPSISPSPHHQGYYSHHPQHSYPPQPQPQQHSFYHQGYYAQPQQTTTQSQHYQQQWGHHSYYAQQQSVSVASPHSQQSPYQAQGYPPQPQSPYAYVQHQPSPQQHSGLPQQANQAGTVSLGQPQQQPQHALMNLSRFVSQQSPSPSPVPPHPHSPTTPVPMGSPHYATQHGQGQTHMSQPQPLHQPAQSQHNHSAMPNNNILPPPYHSPSANLQSQSQDNLGRAKSHSSANVDTNNHAIVQSSSEIVQSAKDISSVNANNHPMGIGSMSTNGGRSESNSPSSGCSSSKILSPPATPGASTSNANGHLIPVRLQNMQKGARTKASMRKLMQEQQNLGGQIGNTQDEALSLDPSSKPGKKPSNSPKKASKSPKKSKKGAPITNDLDTHSDPLPPASNERLHNPTTDTVAVLPGYTKKGKKIGRPPKPKVVSEEETPKKKGRKPKANRVSDPQAPTEPENMPSSPVKTLSTPKTPSQEDKEASPEKELTPVDVDKPKQKGSGKKGVKKSPKKVSLPTHPKKGKIPKGKKSPKSAKEPEPIRSDSEIELDSVVGLDLMETPKRPTRSRAAKSNSTDTKNSERGRQARVKRASVSYKEMSTSRSKSPKEVSTPSPMKKSPSPVKKSPKTGIPLKISPRLKEASPSPSPVRVRQLKEQSPAENKRETRSSKERDDETPKRAPRKSKSKSDSDATPVETTASPLAKRSRKASKSDTTPIRVSSPRLAKERSSTPAGSAKAEPQDTPKTTKTKQTKKAKGSVVSVKATTPKTPKAAPEKTTNSRKRKSTEDVTAEIPDQEPTTAQSKKKPKVATTGKQRKKRGSGPKSAENSTVNATYDDISLPNEPKPTVKLANDIDVPGKALPETANESQPPSKETSFEAEAPLNPGKQPKSKGIKLKPVVLDSRHRSKSPCQSLDSLSNSSLVSHPIVVLPQLDTNVMANAMDNRKEVNIPVDPTSVQKPLVPSIPPTKTDDPVAVPNSELKTANAKVKKPRKPRAPKVKVENVAEGSITDTGSDISSITKTSKVEQQRLEFQRRKANLEVEVAQALLEMKHSSKSPSPVKSLESSVVSTSPAIPTKPKAKRRKSTTTTNDMTTPEKASVLKVVPPKLSPDSATVSFPTAPQSKPKKLSKAKLKQQQRLQSDYPLTSTPTILAVPQINGNQSLNFSCNSSISFQNTPTKVGGPVKVSKTVIPPGSSKAALTSLSDIDLTIATVSSGIVSPETGSKVKAKRNKKVATKKINKITVPEVKEKLKRKRKKKEPAEVTLGSEMASGSNQPTGSNQNLGDMAAPARTESMDSSVGDLQLSTEVTNTENSEIDVSQPVPKKKRKAKPEPFQLTPKSVPKPTVFVKPALLLTTNGPTAGTSAEKDKTPIGPNLKVIGGKTKFFRGGEEEELNAEPQLPKRVPTQFDPDVPWLCCFCNLGPHEQKLGDLFGPYYSEKNSGSGKVKTSIKVETWMHQDCALWAGSVVLIGSKLHGLEETLSHSKKDTCTTCGNKGATIGCLKRGCKQAVHYPCAIRKSWKLDEDSFHSFCPAHNIT